MFRASEVVFYSKLLVEGFLCDSHHCQSTLVGKSESFNELFKSSPATKFCRAFTSKNAKKLDFVNDDQVDGEDDEDSTNACPQFRKTFFWESSRKSLSSAVWMWLSISEAKDRNILESTLFGPKFDSTGERISLKESLTRFMRDVDVKR